jgi:hypothetical protein
MNLPYSSSNFNLEFAYANYCFILSSVSFSIYRISSIVTLNFSSFNICFFNRWSLDYLLFILVCPISSNFELYSPIFNCSSASLISSSFIFYDKVLLCYDLSLLTSLKYSYFWDTYFWSIKFNLALYLV